VTTFVDFSPPPNRAFTFQPDLDGATYQATVSWCLFGQRWLLNLFDPNGDRVLTSAVVGSDAGIATTSLTWDGRAKRVKIVLAAPHGQPLGQVTEVTVRGVHPESYNGTRLAYVTSPTTLTYEQADDPDPSSPDEGSPAITQGSVFRADTDLVAGYFQTSRLVFRQSSQQFEVEP
jgi:hypothetical protein